MKTKISYYGDRQEHIQERKRRGKLSEICTGHNFGTVLKIDHPDTGVRVQPHRCNEFYCLLYTCYSS